MHVTISFFPWCDREDFTPMGHLANIVMDIATRGTMNWLPNHLGFVTATQAPLNSSHSYCQVSVYNTLLPTSPYRFDKTRWGNHYSLIWKNPMVLYSTYQKSLIFCFALLCIQILVNFQKQGHIWNLLVDVFTTPPTHTISYYTKFWLRYLRLKTHDTIKLFS